MNHKLNLTPVVLLIVVVLVVTACSAPQEVSNPTSAALACPTSAAQYCPTPAAQAMPEINNWRLVVARNAQAIITFDNNDNASMQLGATFTENGGLAIDVVANDNAYLNYVVWIVTLDSGKTIDDLKKWTNPVTPAAWIHIIGAVVTTPMSRALYADLTPIKADNGPIYFVLQVEGPGARKFIDHFGPLEFYSQ